jgi:hypothetical protein
MASQIVYTYKDVPTLARFSKDDSRIRAVMGPFGSGKSSAMVMEIMSRAQKQAPDGDGIRHTRWMVVRNCYDDITEILTEKRGFQLFKNLLSDDKVATLQGPGQDEIVYQLPSGVAVHDYDGEMLGFNGENVDFLVTPDHKMWVSLRHALKTKNSWSDFEAKTAQEIYNNTLVRVRKDAKWLSGVTEYSEDFFELFGFMLAEGNCNSNGQLNVSQREHGYVDSLMQRNSLIGTWGTSNRQFNISKTNKHFSKIYELFSPLGRSYEKYIPDELKNAPPVHLRSLVKGFALGDGNEYNGTIRLYTSSQRLADDLQEISIKAGLAANLNSRDRRGRKSTIFGKETQCNHIEYIVTILGEKKYRPVLRGDNKKTGWYKQDYHGKVYCVELPEVPVCVRRKGQYIWALRTYPQLRDSTIKTFLDWVPPKYFGKFNDTYHEYTIDKIFLPDGTQVLCDVLFRALDRPDHVRNLLSLELTGAWLNEAREIPKAILDGLDGRIDRWPSKRKGGATWAGIFLDTNPPDVDHWWFKLFETEKPKGHVIFKQPSGRGPEAENLSNLVPGYYANLAVGKDPEFVKVYVDGQYGFVMDGQVVFPNWNDTLHMATEVLHPTVGLPVVIGFDFGVRNPAAVIGQYHPRGKMLILDEIVAESMGIRQFYTNLVKPLLLTKYRGYEIIATGDPSGAKRSDNDERSCFLELKDMGLPAVPAWSQSIEARINAVDSFLTKLSEGVPSFQLSPNCNTIRKGFNGGYHYRRVQASGDERFYNIPEKNSYSHPMDALQYVCMYLDHSLQVNRQRTLHLSPYTAQVGVSAAAWT